MGANEKQRRAGYPALLVIEGGLERLKVSISEIKVGERRREDYGDVAGLAASIERYGLIQPIVLDDDNRLVAGGRRLEAHKLLGREEVEVRNIGELADAELRELELEENLRRKDLTSYERSRKMVEYAKAARVASNVTGTLSKERTETHSTVEQVSKPSRGPSREAGSYKDVAERTGIPSPTLHRAEKHVAAVEKYPELKDVSQSRAIEVGRRLDKLSEPEREKGRKALRGEPTVGEILGDEAENAAWNISWDVPPEGKEYRNVVKWVDRVMKLDPEKIASYCKDDYEAGRDLEHVHDMLGWFSRYESALQKRRQELKPGNLRAVN